MVTYIHRQGNLQFHSECILGDCCENNIHNENLEKQSLVYRTKQQLINARYFLANHSSSILLNEMRLINNCDELTYWLFLQWDQRADEVGALVLQEGWTVYPFQPVERGQEYIDPATIKKYILNITAKIHPPSLIQLIIKILQSL